MQTLHKPLKPLMHIIEHWKSTPPIYVQFTISRSAVFNLISIMKPLSIYYPLCKSRRQISTKFLINSLKSLVIPVRLLVWERLCKVSALKVCGMPWEWSWMDIVSFKLTQYSFFFYKFLNIYIFINFFIDINRQNNFDFIYSFFLIPMVPFN